MSEEDEILTLMTEIDENLKLATGALENASTKFARLSELITNRHTTPPQGWLWPVLDQDRVITHRFNEPREYRGLKHEGVDLRAYPGKKIVATKSGKIVKVYHWGGGRSGADAYGNYVILAHDEGGYSTLYGHMDHIETGIAEGVAVPAGGVIGYAGCTGNCQGAHLHFQVIHPTLGLDGYCYPKVVDPTSFLESLLPP